jgi:hypothetical protein
MLQSILAKQSMDQHGYFGILSMKQPRSGRVAELFLKGNANLLFVSTLSYAFFHLIFVVPHPELQSHSLARRLHRLRGLDLCLSKI